MTRHLKDFAFGVLGVLVCSTLALAQCGSCGVAAGCGGGCGGGAVMTVSYTHLRAHETLR